MSGGATPITLSPGVATLSFTIEHTSLERDARGNVYTAYRVVTLHQGQEWAVSKRFNDFRALHELMKVHLPELPSNFPLWPNVFNRFDPAVIEERKVGLQRYLSDLVGQLRHRHADVLPSDLERATLSGAQPPLHAVVLAGGARQQLHGPRQDPTTGYNDLP